MDLTRAVLLVAGCASGEVATPPRALPSAPPVTPRDDPPKDAARIDPTEDSAWARAIPQSESFFATNIPEARSLLFTWYIGPIHSLKKEGEPGADFTENFVSTVELVVGSITVTFGNIPG